MNKQSLSTIPSCVLVPLMSLVALLVIADGALAQSPITIELMGNFASFTNSQHAGNRIGYRFHEHTPLTHGPVPTSNAEAEIAPGEADRFVRQMSKRPGGVRYFRRVTEKGWVAQTWTFYLAPAEDGIDLLLLVETGDEGLNRYYGIQQCFRMSGRTNAAWRQKIALTPAFSEYDLWDRQKGQPKKTSLSYVLRKGEWQALPATTETVGCRTPFGVRIDTERSGGNLDAMKHVGPYEALMLEPIDCGLITRTDSDGTWVCGIFWEGTSHVTDHHPADCLHAIVNIGNIPPNAKRAVRGKIYWFRGTKDQLRQRWQRQFMASGRPDN